MPQVMEEARSDTRLIPSRRVRRTWLRWESVEFFSSLAVGALVLVGALLYVWQHIHVVRLGYEIEQLRERQASLVQESKVLRLEMGQLRSLKRVEEIARKRLGMTKPQPGQVVLIPKSAVQ
ncbi:MAG TPA: cell division protein FtsL [Candidatus Methylomirabilis sp.]|nr:cell division protein FtsL [Candidatus Methylomirabilis sp.]